MTASDFKKLRLEGRWKYLEDGEFYMTSRSFNEFRVDLHYDGELFIEIWKKIGLNQIYWFELVEEQKALNDYVDLKLN